MMGSTKNLFVFVTVCSLVSTAYCISCYKCLWDNNVPDLPNTSIDCARNPFDEDKVKQEAGFKQCYRALVYENGEVVSAHRGGGSASVYEIAEKVSREKDSISVEYCYEDLCNGAPSIGTSLGLITSSLLLLRSMYQ